jgi:hypothetical protein
MRNLIVILLVLSSCGDETKFYFYPEANVHSDSIVHTDSGVGTDTYLENDTITSDISTDLKSDSKEVKPDTVCNGVANWSGTVWFGSSGPVNVNTTYTQKSGCTPVVVDKLQGNKFTHTITWAYTNNFTIQISDITKVISGKLYSVNNYPNMGIWYQYDVNNMCYTDTTSNFNCQYTLTFPSGFVVGGLLTISMNCALYCEQIKPQVKYVTSMTYNASGYIGK